MFKTKARGKLNRLADRLSEAGRSIDEHAKDFHRRRLGLQQKIVEECAGWWPFWISRVKLNDYKADVEDINRVAEDLEPLLEQAATISNRAQELSQRAAAEWKRKDLAERLRSRLDGLRAHILRQTGSVQRKNDLHRLRSELESIRLELHRYEKSMTCLMDADHVLGGVQKGVETAALESELSGMYKQLERGPISEESLSTLEQLLEPLKKLLANPPERPPELENVGLMLTKIREWLAYLEQDQQQVESHEERWNRLCSEGRAQDQDELRSLVADAQKLQDSLAAQARQHRRAKLDELKKNVDHLAARCGSGKELEEEIKSLEVKEAALQDANQHNDWLELFKVADTGFMSALYNDEENLRQLLGDERKKLKKSIRKLRRTPLSDLRRAEVDTLELKVDELKKIDLEMGAMPVLEALERCKEYAENRQDISKRALEDRESLIADRKQLIQRIEDLKNAAKQDGEEISALDEEHKELEEGKRADALDQDDEEDEVDESADLDDEEAEDHQQSLEKARQRVSEIAARVEKQEQEFASTYQKKAAELLVQARKAASAVGEEAQLGSIKAIAPETRPLQAVAFFIETRQLKERLLDRVDQRTGELHYEKDILRARLNELEVGTLRNDDRQSLEQYQEELRNGRWSETEDPVDKLLLLQESISKCDQFLEMVTAEEEKAKNRHSRLRHRMQEFRENQLQPYCPEPLVERTLALIDGVPQKPRTWHELAPQLSAAEEALAHLEEHAQKRAAADFEEAVELLEQHQRRRRLDSRIKTEIDSALEEIGRLGHEVTVPVLLRSRVDRLRRSLE